MAHQSHQASTIIMAKIASFLFALLSLFWVSNTQLVPSNSCGSCGCWERCFASVPHPSLSDEYARLYQFVNQIRAGKALNNVRSSVLLADLSQPNYNSFRLQKNLMKMATYALNSGRQCNPTAFAGHTTWGAFWW